MAQPRGKPPRSSRAASDSAIAQPPMQVFTKGRHAVVKTTRSRSISHVSRGASKARQESRPLSSQERSVKSLDQIEGRDSDPYSLSQRSKPMGLMSRSHVHSSASSTSSARIHPVRSSSVHLEERSVSSLRSIKQLSSATGSRSAHSNSDPLKQHLRKARRLLEGMSSAIGIAHVI